MQTTYRIKASDVSNNLIESIKELFSADELITITVSSEEKTDQYKTENILKFRDIEKKFPVKHVTNELDFNTISDEMNL